MRGAGSDPTQVRTQLQESFTDRRTSGSNRVGLILQAADTMHYTQKYFLLISTLQVLNFQGAATQLLFHVLEEQEEDTLIGNLGNSFPSPAPLQYKLLSHTNYFRLDSQSGNLYTTADRLDRESLCPLEAEDRCSMTLDVFISSQEHSEFTKVTLFILDINDNRPYFSESIYTISVPEDAAVGTSFVIDQFAKDLDIDHNADLSYQLISPDDIFTLDQHVEFLMLTLLRPLDRELRSEHTMGIIAFDNGFPPLSGSATLVVHITDVNDNCPVFLTNNVSVTLPRNKSVGDRVLQLQAVDADDGENSIIEYYYSTRVAESIKNRFSLDRSSGLLTLSEPLQDDVMRYRLSIIAVGLGCFPAVALVTINLEKIVKKPKIEVRFIASHNEGGISIQEDVPPGTIIAILDITDPDGSISGPLFINESSPFYIRSSDSSSDTFLLLTSSPLDFELKEQYDITIMGNSTINESFTVTETVKIQIEDVNDNNPTFLNNLEEIFIEENNVPGDLSLTLSASDEDSGSNGNISYYLLDGDPKVFSIDSVSGTLRVSISLDREMRSSYMVHVIAMDHGSPSLNDSCVIAIEVLDQNDNPPTFASNEFTFFIPEDLPHQGEVGYINVTDVDSGVNGDVSVHLMNTTSLFSVGQDRIIRLQGPLDYEKVVMYELWLEARDKGSPSLTSRVKALVVILDVNDNAPFIVLPESNFSYVLVPPDTSPGSSVTKVHAIDYDVGLNGVITYTEYGEIGPTANLFKVDANTGNIILKESTNSHHCGLYQLLVKASDQGYPEVLSTIVWVNILLNQSISNRSYVESLIMMSKNSMTQENQVITLEPCLKNPPAMAPFSWSLTAPVCLAIMSVSIICCMAGAFLFLCSRRNSKKEKQSPDIQLPLQLNVDCYTKDWHEVKSCDPPDGPGPL
ncbi:protocadherin-20-like [Dendrobates tinctorius]|uniref:protocadherin-20-like n=1 Tax=Dendrobates tinctorius TaxID=92724 RepID=UPI003CC9F134